MVRYKQLQLQRDHPDSMFLFSIGPERSRCVQYRRSCEVRRRKPTLKKVLRLRDVILNFHLREDDEEYS